MGFDGVVGSAEYSLAFCIHRYCHRSSSYNNDLHQNLFSCETPQESNTGPAKRECSPNERNGKFASLIKSAIGTFYGFLVFLVCYLPIFICLALLATFGPNIALNRSLLFSCTLVFFNSCLNPVIYCWKIKHIRQKVMNILRNMSCPGNRASS